MQERVRNGQKSEGGREREVSGLYTALYQWHGDSPGGRDGERAVSSGRERGSRKDRVTKEEE